MREIKFRLWSLAGKKMIYTEESIGINVLLDSAMLQFPIKEPASMPTSVWLGENKLMQYTGICDKNGKEIYEGDIVKVKDRGTEAIFEIRWRQEGEPMWILYPNTKERWCLHCIEIHGEYRDNGVTVIGNIYDDPELLGGAHDEQE